MAEAKTDGWRFYSFHFLNTVSQQLVDKLGEIQPLPLTKETLKELGAFQDDKHAKQGIYVLYVAGGPVYLGKAENVEDRLSQHLNKLSGRNNIVLAEVGFKALLLDRSMSTAANEATLIAFFSKSHKGLWNKRGFGPKDPGRRRDTTRPGFFDQNFPIRTDYPVPDVEDEITIGALFTAMKAALPFVFRYQRLPAAIARITLDLRGVAREAGALLRHALLSFPPGWHAAFVSFGMVVYRGSKAYWHTAEVIVSPGSPPAPPPITDEDEDEENEDGEENAADEQAENGESD
jgi:hypothetical protein